MEHWNQWFYDPCLDHDLTKYTIMTKYNYEDDDGNEDGNDDENTASR